MQGEEQYEQSLESMSEEGEYRCQRIEFPAAASQLSQLYDIYKRNALKITRLNRQLAYCQTQIADLQQLADQRHASNVIDFMQQENEQDGDSRLRVYNQLREKRRGQQEHLQSVYKKLKLLATEENMLSNKQMSGLLHQWLANHKKVVGVRVEGEELLVLSRESRRCRFQRNKNDGLGSNHKRSKSKGDSLGSFERSFSRGTSGSSDQTSKHKNQQSWYYCIRVMNISDLIKRLQQSGVQNSPQLQARKNQQETYNMLIRLIRMRLKKKGSVSSEMNRKAEQQLQKNRGQIYSVVFKLVNINEQKQKGLIPVSWQYDCQQLRQANKRQAEIQSKLVQLINTSEQIKNLSLSEHPSKAKLQQLYKIEAEIDQNLFLLISINQDKKQYLPLENLEESGESLQRKKIQAESEVNLVRLISLNYKSKGELQLCAYSRQLRLYFLYEKSAKILVVKTQAEGLTSTGKVADVIELDVKDQVILLQSRTKKLYVGTKEGVFRIYQIIANNKPQLLHIYRCFHQSAESIKTYYLPPDSSNSTVYFISEQRQVFEFNPLTYLVTKIGDISERAITIFGNYLITDNYIEAIVFKNPLQLTKNQKLTNWYTTYRLSNSFKPIVYIQNEQKLYKVLTIDKKGNVSVIFV